LLRVTGAGTVDIPNKTLAYRVDPKVVASLDGQGGSQDLEGFAVPIRIEGPWGRPRIYPEIEGILQDPQKALDQLRKLGGGLFGAKSTAEPETGETTGKSVEDRINEELSKGLGKLFGGSGNADEAQPPGPTTAIEAPASEETAAPPGEQPPAEQPTAELPPAAGQQAAEQPTSETVPDEASTASEQEAPQQGGDSEPADPPSPTDQPVDLLKSLFGQ
jgi:AsmA protein